MKLCIALPATVDKKTLLQASQQVFNFPAYFGHNWDALADSLEEYLQRQNTAITLKIDQRQVQRRDVDAWQAYLDILQQAEQQWPLFTVEIAAD